MPCEIRSATSSTAVTEPKCLEVLEIRSQDQTSWRDGAWMATNARTRAHAVVRPVEDERRSIPGSLLRTVEFNAGGRAEFEPFTPRSAPSTSG